MACPGLTCLIGPLYDDHDADWTPPGSPDDDEEYCGICGAVIQANDRAHDDEWAGWRLTNQVTLEVRRMFVCRRGNLHAAHGFKFVDDEMNMVDWNGVLWDAEWNPF